MGTCNSSVVRGNLQCRRAWTLAVWVSKLIVWVAVFSSSGVAWQDHTLLTRRALAAVPLVSRARPVLVETLDQFLAREQEGLVKVLADEESWARRCIPSYRPRPDSLAFVRSERQTVRNRFLRAIRVNPGIKTSLYLKLAPGEAAGSQARSSWHDIANLEDDGAADQSTYVAIMSGQLVQALEVVASGADEPDYGFDIGLFEDNGTEFGAAYGFGAQSFGNPKLAFSSQAPFHMGFYHESGMVYRAGSFLKRCYPEARIHLYQSLSRYAFATGHEYWGWRFAGWGNHYVQDLAYPYHARVLPGMNAARMIWINAFAMLGLTKCKENAVQIVSNRHLAFERYARQVTLSDASNGQAADGILAALGNVSADNSYGQWHDRYVRDSITSESFSRADPLDSAIARWMPAKLVSDPAYSFRGGDEDSSVLRLVREKGEDGVAALNKHVRELYVAVGAHTRVYSFSVFDKGAEN